MIAAALSLSSCNLEPPEITNPVTWYVVNGWNSQVTFQIWDDVCNRRLTRIRLRVREEIQVTTCGDEDGLAQVRYRRDSFGMPWSDGRARNGQRLQMQ